jgi:hypothetical protein
MLVSEREMVSKITRRGSYLKFLNTSCQNKTVMKKEETNHTGAFMTAAPETPHLAQTQAVIFAYNGTVYSSNFADSDFFVLVYAAKERWEDQTDHTRYLCLHSGLQHRTDDPKKIYRYADFCVHPDLLVAILEDHHLTTRRKQTVRNSLCVINSTATTCHGLGLQHPLW